MKLLLYAILWVLGQSVLTVAATAGESAELAVANQETKEKLVAIHTERERIESLLPQFVNSLALPGKPYGRFKFHKEQEQPWLLYASQQMLSLTVRHGLWDKLDKKKKRQWLNLLLSSQDPKTGLFRCPVETNQPTEYYRSITLKMARVLRSIGVKPRYPLPKAETETSEKVCLICSFQCCREISL